MKIGEKLHFDDDKVVIQRTHDLNPELQRAEMLRKAGVGMTGEKRLVGTIPLNLIESWCKEAGVKWDDVEARKQIVKRKILSGDFDKFRVWKGTY